jgi:hypothetical protein
MALSFGWAGMAGVVWWCCFVRHACVRDFFRSGHMVYHITSFFFGQDHIDYLYVHACMA